MRKSNNKILIALAVGISLLSAPLAFGQSIEPAASLFLSPSSGTYALNKPFAVNIKVNTGGIAVNAAQGTIDFDTAYLEVIGVSRNSSIFKIWTIEPSFDNSKGVISFGGGIPKDSYLGADGIICSITFKAKKTGNAVLRFSSGAVLASDGKGTNVLASMGSAAYTISPEVTPPPSDDKTDIENQGVENGQSLPSDINGNLNSSFVSSTHPNQNAWYKERKIKFSWKLPVGATDVSFSFDKNQDKDPGPTSDGSLTEKEVEATEEGIWYFHLKFKSDGKWGEVMHYRVMIDDNPPLPINAKLVPGEPGDWPTLEFMTSDLLSGLDKYQILIGSLENQAHELSSAETSLKISKLEPGPHTALITAIDKAGNQSVTTISFNIDPIDAPKINNFPAEIDQNDRFYMSGTAIPDATLEIFIQPEGKDLTKDIIKSDASGNWFYIKDDNFTKGRYIAWVEAVNSNGLRSGAGNKISFLVSPPIFVRVGSFVVDYFTVFASLLFVIILTLLLIYYLVEIVRKRLKKETVEVETVLNKNLDELKSAIDQELKHLRSDSAPEIYHQEKTKARIRLQRNIDSVSKKIMKEIKDVEQILK